MLYSLRATSRLISFLLRPRPTCRIGKSPVCYSHWREQSTEVNEMGKEKLSFQLKTPKGTRDWDGKDVVLRDQIFSKITEVFKRHGAVSLDT